MQTNLNVLVFQLLPVATEVDLDNGSTGMLGGRLAVALMDLAATLWA